MSLLPLSSVHRCFSSAALLWGEGEEEGGRDGGAGSGGGEGSGGWVGERVR